MFDVFTKIYWRSWSSLWMKNFWCIHEDLWKTLIKFRNENFLIDSRRLIEDPDKVYEWKTFDVFTKIHEEMIKDPDQVYEWKTFDVFTKIDGRPSSSL